MHGPMYSIVTDSLEKVGDVREILTQSAFYYPVIEIRTNRCKVPVLP
jgi:hypothetical protein